MTDHDTDPLRSPEAASTQSLRRQLGLSYMRVTFLAVVALQAIVLLLAAQSVLYTAATVHDEVAGALAPVAGRLLAAEASPDTLQTFLDRPLPATEAGRSVAFVMPHPPQGWTVVTDADGTVWFDNRRDGGGSLGWHARRLVDAALSSGASRIGREPTRRLRSTPVEAPDGTRIGALLQVSTLPQAAPGLLVLALGGLLLGSLAVVSLGTWFGLIASRPLTRRIDRLAKAADAWSRGDLTRSVDDQGDDELGRLSRRLDRMAREVADLLHERQLFAAGEERTRIARELHDSVKQQLFAASMRLGAARIVPPAEADDQLASVARLLDEAKNELSHLIHELRPTALAGREIEDALRSLVGRYEAGEGPTFVLHVDANVRASPNLSAALYRIVQEAVSNALRHADAARIEVHLEVVDGMVELRIGDDGRGFDTDASRPGVGLASMRERAARLGGTLDVRSRSGRGTTVVAILPMREEDASDVGTTASRMAPIEEEDE